MRQTESKIISITYLDQSHSLWAFFKLGAAFWAEPVHFLALDDLGELFYVCHDTAGDFDRIDEIGDFFGFHNGNLPEGILQQTFERNRRIDSAFFENLRIPEQKI